MSMYIVKNIPPPYRLGPNLSEYHSILKGFKEAVHRMERTNEERKTFLIERYDWLEFSKLSNQGIINTGDLE